MMTAARAAPMSWVWVEHKTVSMVDTAADPYNRYWLLRWVVKLPGPEGTVPYDVDEKHWAALVEEGPLTVQTRWRAALYLSAD